MVDDQQPSSGRRLSRRHLLLGGAAAGIGAVSAMGLDLASQSGAGDNVGDKPVTETGSALESGSAGQSATTIGVSTLAFHGSHQAGIDTPAQAHSTYLAIDLLPEIDRAALRRLMRVLTQDAVRLSAGSSALADSEPELALIPARLTVTFGFGPGLVARTAGESPDWLKPLPAFTVDRLDPAWNDGDLLLVVAADDPLTVAHSVRMLLKDTRTFGTLRWVQPGFRRAAGAEKAGTTMRNLFGQVDGTVNLVPGTADFETLVWCGADSPDWLVGGTGFVLRRISMDLDKWDRLDRSGRELAVGRTLSNGAPLTGSLEADEPDFEATTPIGFPVIPEFSHIRRARSDNPAERIYRRGYNYDALPDLGNGGGISNSGLLFASFQADVTRQFVPIQQRLDDLDLLNEWITPIGSAVFAIPTGCEEGGYIGETLF